MEKGNSIYCKGNYTDTQVQRIVPSNPFKHFEDIQMLCHTKIPGVIRVDESVWKKLILFLLTWCDETAADGSY